MESVVEDKELVAENFLEMSAGWAVVCGEVVCESTKRGFLQSCLSAIVVVIGRTIDADVPSEVVTSLND